LNNDEGLGNSNNEKTCREEFFVEKHYHTSDWASYEMLQSANALMFLAVTDNGQPKEDPLLFLIPSILMAYTAIQTRVNEAVEEYFQKHEKSFPVKYVRKVAKQAPPSYKTRDSH